MQSAMPGSVVSVRVRSGRRILWGGISVIPRDGTSADPMASRSRVALACPGLPAPHVAPARGRYGRTPHPATARGTPGGGACRVRPAPGICLCGSRWDPPERNPTSPWFTAGWSYPASSGFLQAGCSLVMAPGSRSNFSAALPVGVLPSLAGTSKVVRPGSSG